MEKKEILLKLRQETGMNRREFAEYFGIPYRTVQEWELGHREMPGYLLRLMYYHEKNKRKRTTPAKDAVGGWKNFDCPGCRW